MEIVLREGEISDTYGNLPLPIIHVPCKCSEFHGQHHLTSGDLYGVVSNIGPCSNDVIDSQVSHNNSENDPGHDGAPHSIGHHIGEHSACKEMRDASVEMQHGKKKE